MRKERFSGKCSRTFYVGDDVEEDDIKAKFEDGVLKIAGPKKQEQPKLEEKKTTISQMHAMTIVPEPQVGSLIVT